eukprot:2777437-Rhodomonas_salina.3
MMTLGWWVLGLQRRNQPCTSTTERRRLTRTRLTHGRRRVIDSERRCGPTPTRRLTRPALCSPAGVLSLGALPSLSDLKSVRHSRGPESHGFRDVSAAVTTPGGWSR